MFVRLTGCPLRCVWCDTEYAFHGGQWRTIDEVLAEVAILQVRHVCVTGGEPLAQKRCLGLLARLCDAGYEVSLETSGALDIADVDPRVRRVVDLKAPGSGEVARNLWSNIDHLTAHDQLKIVIADRTDYDWARARLIEHALVRSLPGVVLARAWPHRAARAGRMDPRRPPRCAHAGADAQAAVGRCSGALMPGFGKYVSVIPGLAGTTG